MTVVSMKQTGRLLTTFAGLVIFGSLLSTLAGCASSGVDIPLPPDSRSFKEIQLGFERGIAKFQAVRSAYAAEYPDTPTRKVYLSFTVAPDGSMVECVAGSKNTAPIGLTRVIAEQAMSLKFGARDVPPFHYENLPLTLVYDEPPSSAGTGPTR